MSFTKLKLSQALGKTSKTKYFIETILETIKQKLERGEEVKISGFGRWEIRQKGKRKGRNPHTGEKMEIMARKIVVFKPSQKLWP